MWTCNQGFAEGTVAGRFSFFWLCIVLYLISYPTPLMPASSWKLWNEEPLMNIQQPNNNAQTKDKLINAFRGPVELLHETSLWSGILAITFQGQLRQWRAPSYLTGGGLGIRLGWWQDCYVSWYRSYRRQSERWRKFYLLHFPLLKVILHQLNKDRIKNKKEKIENVRGSLTGLTQKVSSKSMR